VTIRGVSSAGSGGEVFDLTDDSRLQCDSIAIPLAKARFDPATGTITKGGISQLRYFGNCTVTIGLVESSGQPTPLYYGGVTSKRATTDVSLGQAASATVSANDFTAEWPASGSAAQLTYTGDEQLDLLTQSWSEVLKRPGDDPLCGTADTQFRGNGDTASVPGNDCVGRFGDQTTGWVITVSWADQSDGQTHSVDVRLADGAPATYQPCTPGAFTASWGTTRTDPVSLTQAGGDVSGCSDWSAELQAGDGTSCGTSTDAPNPTAVIPITCGTAPAADWTVSVSYRKPDGTVAVATATLGTPPDS
jgi:hypothetical protein